MLKRVWTVSNGKIWKKCNYVHSPEALLSKVAPAAENLFFARRSQGHSWCHFPWFRRSILLARFFTYCPKVQKGKGKGSGQFWWNVFSKFCTALWARNAAIETDWHVVKPGHSARLVDGEGAVFFRVCWIFSPPLILAQLDHSLCQSIPWFPSLCCRLNLYFFHSCFQMVKGSRLQQLAHKICNNLVHFPDEF